MSFLSAEWRKLALVNYEIDKNLLKDYLPYKTELDLWNNTCYVSLVGFMFLNTRILSIKIPFHINFEEVNLRFYVKFKDGNVWKRGVVFIKEIVPKPAISFVANVLYKEHYQSLPMNHQWTENELERTVIYQWKSKNIWQKFEVIAQVEPSEIKVGSEAEFITEHYWGYSKINKNKTYEYEVTHPRWQQYDVLKHHINVDFEMVYGSDFKVLNSMDPKSVMLAEGSKITVEKRKQI